MGAAMYITLARGQSPPTGVLLLLNSSSSSSSSTVVPGVEGFALKLRTNDRTRVEADDGA